MKKIGKKINYLVKVFMAFGLLFTNVMPLTTVLADELENQNVAVGDNQNGDGNGLENNGPGYVSTDQGDNGNENGEETLFSVELNDEKQYVVKYTGEYQEGWTLTVSEKLTYLDGTDSGETNMLVELTDEVKATLAEGYVLDSVVLKDNVFPGEFEATVTLGENTETINKTIAFSDSGFGYEMYALDEELTGVMVEPDELNKYTVGKNYSTLRVIARVYQGSACPSMTFTDGENEYTAEALMNGINVLEVPLKGHLYGEFTVDLVGTFTGCDGVTTEVNESRTILYGAYQDNTDKINESAKKVELEKKYTFFGDTKDGYVYNYDEIDTDELTSILDDFVGESEFITAEVTYENDELMITLTDEYGTVVTYGSVEASAETKIDARLAVNSDVVTTGDEFTVNYLVTVKDFKVNGVGGLVKYDEELLRLTGITASKFTGNDDNGKFIYTGDSLTGTAKTDDEGYDEAEYVVLTLTFEALKAGEANIEIDDAVFYNEGVYYEANDEIATTVIIDESSDSSLSSLRVAGQDISLEDDKLEYEITVGNEVTSADVEALEANIGAQITSIVAPEELAVGENIITIVVMAENGDEKVYTIKVIREAAEKKDDTTVAPVSYQENTIGDNDDNDDGKTPSVITPKDDDDDDDTSDETNNGQKITRIIIIILILLAVAGLIYLIFKDENDEETKKANKEIDKLKKENNNNFKKIDNDKKPKKKER